MIDGTVIDLLGRWLPQQRWFAGQQADNIHIESQQVLDLPISVGWHIIVCGPDRYQLYIAQLSDLTGTGSLPPHAVIGVSAAGQMVVDALYLPQVSTALLSYLAQDQQIGPLRSTALTTPLPGLGAAGVALGGEQSNTSLRYGQAAILKVLRRVQPGINPDFEVNQALTAAGCHQVPRLYGVLSGPVADHPDSTLAILTEYFPDATDGFQSAVQVATAVHTGAAPPQTFATSAEELGAAVAQVHQHLAEAFGTGTADNRLFTQMADQARLVAQHYPDLAPALPDIARLYQQAATAPAGPSQRIHGDLHLGQCLHTAQGWQIIDFEGEPSAPLSQRRQLQPPLRDIAGLLRSFDYAAGYPLVAAGDFGPKQLARTESWRQVMRSAFCAGYAEVTGVNPQECGATLRAFELAKAVYEVGYEASYRPDWVAIPLHAVQTLLTQGGTP